MSAVSAQFSADTRFMAFENSRYLGLVVPGFQYGRDLVSLLLGKLRVDSHMYLSFLPERKETMLTQLALYSDLVSCTY